MLDRFRAIRGREICLVSRLCSSNIEVTQHNYFLTLKTMWDDNFTFFLFCLIFVFIKGKRSNTWELSVALSKLGVRRGDVVAIGSKSFLHYIPTTLSVLFSGATYTAYDEALGTGKSINLLYYNCITLNCKYTWLCPIILYSKLSWTIQYTVTLYFLWTPNNSKRYRN